MSNATTSTTTITLTPGMKVAVQRVSYSGSKAATIGVVERVGKRYAFVSTGTSLAGTPIEMKIDGTELDARGLSEATNSPSFSRIYPIDSDAGRALIREARAKDDASRFEREASAQIKAAVAAGVSGDVEARNAALDALIAAATAYRAS